jgi:LCP family protein required for cell wall assembly
MKFPERITQLINLTKQNISSLTTKFRSLKKPYQVIIIMLLLLLPIVAYSSWYYYRIANPTNLFVIEPVEEVDWDANNYFNKNVVNIALLGFDANEDRDAEYTVYRTDSIKVISINFEEKTVNIIDIPRDMYTQIGPSNIYDKINHSYYHGWRNGDQDDRHQAGLDYTLKSISNVLGGIPLSYYVALDMDAVVTLVNSIGGVKFDVPHDVYDKNNKLRIKEGEQVLEGKDYLHYLRNRNIGGDIGRVKRQTDLLLATLDHLRSEGLIRHLPTLYYNSYHDLLDTNLSNQQMISLAMYAGSFKSDEIKQFTLTGRNQSKDGVYYMTLDVEVWADILLQVFGIDMEPPPRVVLTDTIPAPPRSFTATVTANKTISLAWQPGDRYNREYNLYRSVNGGSETLISGKQEGNKYHDTDVQPGNTYRYRIEAVNYRERSDAASTTVTIEAVSTPIEEKPDTDNEDDEPDEEDPDDDKDQEEETGEENPVAPNDNV